MNVFTLAISGDEYIESIWHRRCSFFLFIYLISKSTKKPTYNLNSVSTTQGIIFFHPTILLIRWFFNWKYWSDFCPTAVWLACEIVPTKLFEAEFELKNHQKKLLLTSSSPSYRVFMHQILKFLNFEEKAS